MRKNIKDIVLIIIIAILGFSSLSADEFLVKSFSRIENDGHARKYVKYDINGDACALIKVRTDIDVVINFDSNTGIPVEPELKAKGEYWVYVVEGERALKCMADGFIPKTIPLESAGEIAKLTVYELVLSSKDLNIETLPVSILAEPSGTEKWIDGKNLGRGESFDLSLGKHQLLLKKKGHKSIETQIEVKRSSVLFKNYKLDEIELVPLEICSEPIGARVIINNVEEGVSNLPLWKIPGDYELRLEMSGYISKSEKITVIDREENKYFTTLLKNSGTLKLNIEPSNITCMINKKTYDNYKNVELAPGTYKLELSKEGYHPIEEKITIGEGQELTKEYILKQKTGQLRFSIVPLDAKIIMKDSEGKTYKTWTGMMYDKAVPVGDYDLECSYQGYKTQKFTLNIDENKLSEKSITLEKSEVDVVPEKNTYTNLSKKDDITKQVVENYSTKKLSSSNNSTLRPVNIFINASIAITVDRYFAYTTFYSGLVLSSNNYGNLGVKLNLHEYKYVEINNEETSYHPSTSAILRYELPVIAKFNNVGFTADVGVGSTFADEKHFCWEIGGSLKYKALSGLRFYYTNTFREKYNRISELKEYTNEILIGVAIDFIFPL